VAVDQEGGIVSRVPWAESTGASDLEDLDEAFLVGEKRARDLKEVGVNMNLAPVLDSNGEDDFLFNRSFQKDQDDSLAIAQGLILGHMQEGVIPVPKHFPGYDAVLVHPEKMAIPKVRHIPDTSFFHNLFQEIPLPFAMISHVIYEDFDSVAPFPFSPQGIQLFKKDLGSEVLVISDDLLSEPFVSEYKLLDIGIFSIQSGVDILLVAGYPDPSIVFEFYEEFLSAVKQDLSLQSRVKGSFEEIMKIKRELLFRKGNDTVK
jgi:beta-N-acetylhexosaminidase